ncbi:transketolase [Nocardioides glacieisoli]|uniref:1-deoxy-D-xylulose-5-phosphate synthase n=1 Tax=Nocardioides glacieisoli TaxID=1168730 RepID=A0A4Q2RL81_9ACTN|nr:transketolase C-terminal domain-containing protein [Nocardioides glacieisoli]RYB88554.1 transketolase [Nocardioides glacieisoli]
MRDPRRVFADTAVSLVEKDRSVAVVYAEISGQFFGAAERRHPDRIINVGIREQLLVSVGAGLALTGMRPILHTFSSFLIERAFEQVKLGFGHQDVGGVLVSCGASFDTSSGGRTHQAPGDVSLIDTVPGFGIHVPGHPDEVDAVLRWAVAGSGREYVRVHAAQNSVAFPVTPGRFHVVRKGSRATVVAVGPMLDPVLAAVSDLDVTVLYASTVRPFDSRGLRESIDHPDVVLVEPYLAGTSSHLVAEVLQHLPHRQLALGVGRTELRRYGTPDEHAAAHGLDPTGIRRSITAFLSARAVA